MKNKRVDYNAIVTQRTLDGRIEALEREVQQAGYVCVTDAITHYNFGGALMLERLMRDNEDKVATGDNRKFKLFVMRDEWGNELKPGDVVRRQMLRKFKDKAGRKLRSGAINDMKRRGTWEKEYVINREFVIDPKGCIECTIEDAAWFLSEYGVNFEDTTAALCGRREISSGPCKAPDGTERHIWYWRYWEAPPWIYDKLPNLTETKPKRTRKRSTKKAAQSTARELEETPTVAGAEE